VTPRQFWRFASSRYQGRGCVPAVLLAKRNRFGSADLSRTRRQIPSRDFRRNPESLCREFPCLRTCRSVSRTAKIQIHCEAREFFATRVPAFPLRGCWIGFALVWFVLLVWLVVAKTVCSSQMTSFPFAAFRVARFERLTPNAEWVRGRGQPGGEGCCLNRPKCLIRERLPADRWTRVPG
jgi:hypothetical protein